MKKYLATIFLFVIPQFVPGQELQFSVDNGCTFEATQKSPCDGGVLLSSVEFSDEDVLKKTIYSVMNQLGIMRKLYIGKIRNSSIDGIFFKLRQDNIPRVLIGDHLLEDRWVTLGILFHELGHYINDHENFCSNEELELDADYFAGYCLSKAGADPDEAVRCIQGVKSDNTHPSETKRAEKIIKGWGDQKRSNGIFSYTSINPIVLWEIENQKIIVRINNETFDVKRTKLFYEDSELTFDPEFGMLFLKSKNSTYQLHEYNDHKLGVGSLVNDRTSLVFLRYTYKAFRFYYEGKIVKTRETIDHGWASEYNGERINYKVKYKEDGKVRELIFPNFAYAPLKRIMPASYK